MASGPPTSLPTPGERESPFSTSWSCIALAWVMDPALEGRCRQGVAPSDLWAWSSDAPGLGWGEAPDSHANWKLGGGCCSQKGRMPGRWDGSQLRERMNGWGCTVQAAGEQALPQPSGNYLPVERSGGR